MYGSRLRILVFSCLALSVAVAVSIIAFAPSWSQLAMTILGLLLNTILGSVMLLYFERALTHPLKNELRANVLWLKRQEHINFFICFMFFGILVFPVTHPNKYIEILHLVFTGLVIFGVFLDVITYRHKLGWLFKSLITASVIFFLGCFILGWASIAWGETAIAAAAIVFILKTNKSK